MERSTGAGRSSLMFGMPIGELAILATAVAGGGIVTGIMAGLFGIGGGAVIVPVLYEVFGALGVAEEIRMQLCIGTSLAIIVPTTFRSYFTHRSKNLGLDDVVRKWTLPAVAGSGDRGDSGGGCAFHGLQAGVCWHRRRYRNKAAVRPRQLADCRRSAARPHPPAVRLPHRPCVVADGRQRRLWGEYDHDALRQDDTHGGRDLRRARRPDRNRRHHRLHAGWPSAPEPDAAAHHRLCVSYRLYRDGAGLKLCR